MEKIREYVKERLYKIELEIKDSTIVRSNRYRITLNGNILSSYETDSENMDIIREKINSMHLSAKELAQSKFDLNNYTKARLFGLYLWFKIFRQKPKNNGNSNTMDHIITSPNVHNFDVGHNGNKIQNGIEKGNENPGTHQK